MLIFSLRGENHGFWSHLGCQDETPISLAVRVSFRVAQEEIIRCIQSKLVGNIFTIIYNNNNFIRTLQFLQVIK